VDDQRCRANLYAAPAFLQLPATKPELTMLHRCFGTWAGLGQVAGGLQRGGRDLRLPAYGDGHWRATFYVTGMVHSIVGGSAWERAPWTTVQRAGWAAVERRR
jgi:hypothetical protein